MTYSYSADGEHFDGEFETIQDALNEAKKDYGNDYEEVYVGENGVFHPYVDAEDVVERLKDQAFDQMGEAAESYLEVISSEDSVELSEILTKAFNEWSVKHGYEPRCWPVDNIKTYIVSEATK